MVIGREQFPFHESFANLAMVVLFIVVQNKDLARWLTNF
jgi:hypothetical protein